MSLRYQINLRILLTGIIILILGGVFSIWQVRGAVSKEIDSSLNLAAQLIQLNFPKAEQSAFDISAWLPRFVSLEQTRHLKIQLKKPNGDVVKFTAEPKQAPDLDDPPVWFIKLVATHYPELEQHLIAADGEHITLIIQANPLDEISEAWKESRAFFISLLLMNLLTILTVNLVFNKALKAIGIIVNSLKEIEQDNYQQKLPDFSTFEFDQIAKAIHHMTGVLDATQRENRALTLHSLEIQEEERQYLAKELHDEFGQSLTAIKVMAVTVKNKKAEVLQITDSIIGICDHLITVVRSMMRNLHPLVLKELGLKATLEDLLNHWSTRSPELFLKLNCADAVDALDPKITIQVFRVIQECITNIVRHADAKLATIELTITGKPSTKQLQLKVRDDGKGCALDQLKSGFGLQGMRERIKSLGGDLQIQSSPARGMTVTAVIPLKAG